MSVASVSVHLPLEKDDPTMYHARVEREYVIFDLLPDVVDDIIGLATLSCARSSI